ncbi:MULTISPECIES: hypothetical protein [unclassified Microbacterium]|uniref:hypothetical protein n=1 Tax=unclassified Microbacterium TaxID=2609290 RepID=UPI00386E1CEA
MTEDKTEFTGTVKRTFAHRGGTAAVLHVLNPKAKYPSEVTVWADLDVTMGDRVTVAGNYSDKIDSYQSPAGLKPIIRRSLNEVRLIARHDPPTAEPTDETPPDDAYGPEPTWDVAPIPGQDGAAW